MSGQLTDVQKEELISTIVDESERLNRFIANLLDMTKLESGAIAPNSSLHSIGEVIGSALRRAEKILSRHKVTLDIYRDLPLVKIDEVLFEQAIFNLLDNAAKYSAPGSTIQINGRRDGDSVVLEIVDEGVGIPASDVERIFDKFYRAQKGDQVRPGTGLGLAIARGFIGAMQGTISASNRTDRSGAILTIRLPVTADTAKLDTAA
jgi:two-component system sensor histidine kinase KdpD